MSEVWITVASFVLACAIFGEAMDQLMRYAI